MKYIFLQYLEYKTNLLYVLLNDVYPESIAFNVHVYAAESLYIAHE